MHVVRVALVLWSVTVLGHSADISGMRGFKPVSIRDEQGQTVTFAEHHALVIGNSAYKGGWDPLPGVSGDVDAVKSCLEKLGFDVQVAMNQTKQQLAETLDVFIEEKAQREDARVIVYYAGHGHTEGKVGYLVGVDAPKPSEKGFQRRAYEIASIKIKAQQAKSRHVMFAFDACFAGSVFTPMRGAHDYVLSAAREPVRMFITSGSADEQVPDQSFFRQEFIAGIEGAADSNHDGYVTGSELATYLKQTVRDRAGAAGIRLTPQAGVSEQEGYNRGDMVFPVLKGAAITAVPPSPEPPKTGFDLSDLTKEAATAQTKANWESWQAQCDQAVAQIDALPAGNEELRLKAWQRFLKSFADDNPYSTRDNDYRVRAGREIASLEKSLSSKAPVAPVAATATATKKDPEAEYRVMVGSYVATALNGQASSDLSYLAFTVEDALTGWKKRPRRLRVDNDSTRVVFGSRHLKMEVLSVESDGDWLVVKGRDPVVGETVVRLQRVDGGLMWSIGSDVYKLRRD